MNYFACLVRFWREEENTPWRVTLENPHTTDKQNFASPEQYWQYMQTILSGPELNHTSNERIDNEP
ncbi:MAG: hypothetical protein R6X34_10135 [Chloroflexota bacterium]